MGPQAISARGVPHGRLAASPAVAPLASLRDVEWDLGVYASGRLRVQVVPMLMSDEIWQHPLCSAFDAELRDRMRAAAARADELAAEGDALPRLSSHGDACPNNLLDDGSDDLVLIDFGYWVLRRWASTSSACWSVTSRSASARRAR